MAQHIALNILNLRRRCANVTAPATRQASYTWQAATGVAWYPDTLDLYVAEHLPHLRCARGMANRGALSENGPVRRRDAPVGKLPPP